MKITAFAASSSRNSINKTLVNYACSLLEKVEVQLLDLNDYEMPLFSVDREKELGQPQLAVNFLQRLGESDALVIAFAEHNGSYSAAYKNLFDWCSRIEKKVWQGKPMVLLSTSPGAKGGASVLAMATESAPFFNGVVKASMAIPAFHENFDLEKNLMTNHELLAQLQKTMESLVE